MNMRTAWLNTLINFIKNELPALALVFVLIFLLRLPSSTELVIDWDETVYWIIAQDVAHGGSIYQTSWDNKGPLLFFVFVPVIKLFGNNILALRIFATIYLCITMLFVYLICRRLFGKRIGLVGPLFYGVFFTRSQGGLASNRELFMMLPIALATFCLVEYEYNGAKSRLKLFFCGLFSAASILMIQTNFFIVMLFPLILLIKKVEFNDYTWKLFIRDLSFYLFGGITITAITLCYFVFHNSVYDFLYAFFLYSYKFVGQHSFAPSLHGLVTMLKERINTDGFTIASLISLLIIVFNKNHYEKTKYLNYLVSGLLFFSLLGIVAGKHSWPHYYLQMALVFSILVCFALSAIKIDEENLIKVMYCLLAVAIAANIGTLSVFLNSPSSYKLTEEYEIANYIANNTASSDTIFVLEGGSEPTIYLLSNRRAPTKYFFWLHHTFKDVMPDDNTILMEFSRNKPKYIIYNKSARHELKHIERFMLDNYHVEKEFEHNVLYRVNS